MVVSVNPAPDKEVFEKILRRTLSVLKTESKCNPVRYSCLHGTKLEQTVVDIMREQAVGTPFDNSIELVSGLKFPDIVALKYYGVEVKTTKSNQWKSTGGSVAEGTRVGEVERIFMLFGKMSEPIDFICRPYEDCLSEVVVTHSPRYLIDMKLNSGETIFDKMNTPYEVLRKMDNPIEKILDYYKAKLKPGESTWWSNSNKDTSNVIIRLWNNINKAEQLQYVVKGFCLFPELVSNHSDKFNRFAVWLSIRQGIVCPNIRDIFTAGGQGFIVFNGVKYQNVPQVIIRLANNLSHVRQSLHEIDTKEICEYWGSIDETPLYDQWSVRVSSQAAGILKNGFPLFDFLRSIE